MADDNVVNQKVVMLLLESLGYEADYALDGQEVLEALGVRTYDVILMDIQMPRIDGLEATRRIRRGGIVAEQPRIIAMTAASSHAEQDVCFAAGMDAYLRKPVTVERLRAALVHSQPLAPPADDGRPAPDSAVDFTVVDRLYEVRPNVVIELVRTFLANAGDRLGKVRQALAEGDAESLRGVAHSLKGSASTLGARPLAEICKRLERLCPTEPRGAESLAAAGAAIADLEHEFERVAAAFRGRLRQWTAQDSAAQDSAAQDSAAQDSAAQDSAGAVPLGEDKS